jgi:hypothetical protein
MSTFIWGKIKFKELPKNFNSYQRGDILVFFELQKNDLYMSDLQDTEIYFNIACGYEEMIYLYKYKRYYLNCDYSFFSLNCPKREKNIEPYFKALYNRIKKLQEVILEMYERPEVEKITYFHTDTGNEISIDEYEIVDWKIQDFADRFFEAIKENRGFTPTIKVIFSK